MRIINLFAGYFLALIIIESFLLQYIDAKEFKKKGQENVEKKAKLLAKALMIIGIALFITRYTLR